MRISNERIQALKLLLKEQYDLEYTDEQAQEAGLAIMRFVIAKSQRHARLIQMKEKNDEQLSAN